jgi:hypothetical protein
MAKLVLKTRLHYGIHDHLGGGQVKVHGTWNIGPRNLLKAIREFEQHSQHMTECYGNIGAGHSWLEYDGEPMNDSDTGLLQNIGETKWFIDKYPTGKALAEEHAALEEHLDRVFPSWDSSVKFCD